MKRSIALMMSLLILMLTLGGCGAQKQLVGRWTAQVDLAQSVTALLPESLGQAEIESFPVTLQLELDQSGSYVLSVDAASVQTAFEQVLDGLDAVVERLYADQIADLNISLDEFLAMLGLSVADITGRLRAALQESGLTHTLAERYAVQGAWVLEDGVLALVRTDDTTFASCPFDKNTTQLILTDAFEELGTITFTKQ